MYCTVPTLPTLQLKYGTVRTGLGAVSCLLLLLLLLLLCLFLYEMFTLEDGYR